MEQSSAFALPQSELNSFLFAEIGVEAGGLDLSVISALARSGVDPWQEGARLARLPLNAAVTEIAQMIASMPATLWPQPVATEIATRLVRLLPKRGTAATVVANRIAVAGGSSAEAAKAGFGRDWLSLALLALVVLVGSAVGMARMAPNAAGGAPGAAPIASSIAAIPAQPPAPPIKD